MDFTTNCTKNVTKTWYETWRGENGAEMGYNKVFKDSRYFVHLGMDKYSWGQLEALFLFNVVANSSFCLSRQWVHFFHCCNAVPMVAEKSILGLQLSLHLLHTKAFNCLSFHLRQNQKIVTRQTPVIRSGSFSLFVYFHPVYIFRFTM